MTLEGYFDLDEFFVVFNWVSRWWTMSIHGVSGKSKATWTMNQYFLKVQGPVRQMNWNKETGIKLVCFQVLYQLQHPPNFCLTPKFQSLPWFSTRWSWKLELSPWALVQFSHPLHLIDHQSSFVMLIVLSCLQVCSIIFKVCLYVYELFSICQHRSHSHTKL